MHLLQWLQPKNANPSTRGERGRGEGLLLMRVPGFVDLQVNGFAGVDFNDPSSATADAVTRALDAMRATGVTRCLPTIITSSIEHFAACARV